MTDPDVRYDDAVRLLGALSSPVGIHASAAETANYRAVFTRDAVMAGLAGLLARDDAVVRALVRTLERLRALQGPEGQIASNYEIRDGTPRVTIRSIKGWGTMVDPVEIAFSDDTSVAGHAGCSVTAWMIAGTSTVNVGRSRSKLASAASGVKRE